MTEQRPEWNHPISEADARWLYKNAITKITHHWKFTSEDTTENWVEVHTDAKTTRRFPSGYFTDSQYWRFAPNHRALITPGYAAERAIKDINAIDAWEKKNATERAEYERLKRKFAGA
jgi:hypothetical protein